MKMAYPADDIVMVGEVCLAVLAAVDLARVEVDIVCETHFERICPWSALVM